MDAGEPMPTREIVARLNRLAGEETGTSPEDPEGDWSVVPLALRYTALGTFDLWLYREQLRERGVPWC